MKIFCCILILILPTVIMGQNDPTNTPVPYTLGDRDRIMRTEFKIEKLETKLDSELKAIREKIDTEHKAIHEKIDFSQTIMLAILTLIIGQFVHSIWINYNRKDDQNTKSSPELNQLMNRMEKMEETLNALVKKESFDEFN